MKTKDFCIYSFNNEDFTAIFIRKVGEYRGPALLIQDKIIKKFPRHSQFLRELFMTCRNFIYTPDTNSIFIEKEHSDVKTFLKKDPEDKSSFFEIKLTGVCEIDKKVLWTNQIINKEDVNNFYKNASTSLEITPELAKEIENLIDNQQ